MKINDIFRESKYSQAWQLVKANIENLTIIELPADSDGRRFQIIEIPEPSAKEKAETEILQIKEILEKYKEDVEQVELFGMTRTDYEEKKKACADMILRLRELEKQIKE